MKWLMHVEETDEVTIKHGHNGREYTLPELRNFILKGQCPETNKFYEFFGCFARAHLPTLPRCQ